MDRSTLEALYKSHGYLVLRRARRILGNDQEARDAVQEVFTSLLERPEGFAGKSAATTFLYSVTTNLCLNKLRNATNRQRLLDEQGPPTAQTEAGADVWAIARQLLARMPERSAQAILHHRFDGMTQDEVANVMGCSRRHVNDLLARADDWLRSEVEVR